MGNDDKQTYVLYSGSRLLSLGYATDVICCPVASADMTGWIENKPEEKPLDFFVEIGCDESSLQRTQGVEGKETTSWNEEFSLYVCSPTACS